MLAAIPVLRAEPSYSLEAGNFRAGGGTSSSGRYQLTGSFTATGTKSASSTTPDYRLTGGFWSLVLVQTPGAPLLRATASGSGQIDLSWSPADSGWILQESTTLAPDSWTEVPGGTSPLSLPISGPRKFYRLVAAP